MKIFLMTDMEGVAGVLNFRDWVFPDGRYYDRGKRLLTLEVNAVIDGFCAAGAAEVLVCDGHGPGGIDPELLDERAELMRGAPRPVWPFGLDRSCDAIACVGQHAKAGTPFSHMTHTENLAMIDLTVNGLSIGEYGRIALCAMELGIPAIFAAGEDAFAREAEALTPGVITVGVKHGLLVDGLDSLSAEEYERAKLSAVHLPPAKARKLLRAGAFAAVRKFQETPECFRYPELHPPYTIELRMRHDAHHEKSRILRQHHPSSLIGALNAPSETQS